MLPFHFGRFGRWSMEGRFLRESPASGVAGLHFNEVAGLGKQGAFEGVEGHFPVVLIGTIEGVDQVADALLDLWGAFQVGMDDVGHALGESGEAVDFVGGFLQEPSGSAPDALLLAARPHPLGVEHCHPRVRKREPGFIRGQAKRPGSVASATWFNRYRFVCPCVVSYSVGGGLSRGQCVEIGFLFFGGVPEIGCSREVGAEAPVAALEVLQ